MSPSESGSPNEIDCAILEVALSLDGSLRDRFLEQTFRGNPAAGLEMRELVEASRAASSFFIEARERRANVASDLFAEITPRARQEAQPEGEVEGPGSKLGRYRLVKCIGEGGGGVVYEAEQEHPIRRRVAVKIVRHGMNSEGVIARFEIERQALALMDHPNIAKVLDAGTTANGRPYFVMELVAGEMITRFSDQRKLGLFQRLKLFIQVCHAIQHAHQKGIIHRDIKPSNILVIEQDGMNIPKVIDFGIAKATESRTLNQTSFTAHDQFFGTPAYMSPEQIDMSGLDVDTRSDIFSLGILLYELLTSKTPLDGGKLASFGISKIRHTVLHSEAPPPSLMLGGVDQMDLKKLAGQRKSEPLQLIHSVRGDLDWIVLKAIEKDRSRRYQTVNSLALDVQRFLDHEPVTARPPGRFYLLGKLIRRNRLACGAGLALAISLLAGLIISTTLYERERKARNEQLRLKEEAQSARNNESRLRRQADARANVARVAFLLDQGRTDEADILRQQYPLSSIEPSLEAATVFRALGDWNASRGRWDQAIPCFRLLIQANRLDNPLKILRSSDPIACGAALRRESLDEYASFRQEMLKHYHAPEMGVLEAEHLLKACLMSPADAGFLAQLEPAVAALGDPAKADLPGWTGLALALYELRSGRNVAAFDAGEKALADPQIKLSCTVSLQCVSAILHAREGHTSKAAAELEAARMTYQDSAGRDFVEGEQVSAYWFDWAVAENLINEAKMEINLQD